MSDLALLSSRAIRGFYFAALEVDMGGFWLDDVSNLYGSDQASETYNWLGQTPAMREWLAGRQAKGFTGQGVTILNKHYEATLEIAIKDMRRDKTGQIRARMAELAQRGQTHWASLVSTLIVNGDTTTCYDGEYFFDTDHHEGDSGNQSNKISVTLSTLPVVTHGSTSDPSIEEMQQAILQGIAKILSFVDDKGEPMNELANSFTVMVPIGLYMKALAAVTPAALAALPNNMNGNNLASFTIKVVPNTRLTVAGWTTKFVVFRTDAPTKALIRQTEKEVEFKMKDETSEFAFDNDAIQAGVDGWRGSGYGHWQRTCHVTLA